MSAAATFCATLVDEWCRSGVRHAVIAPGSRSTPMALALAERSELSLHVVHDERAAAFVALGLGLSGVPAVLLCTSGTAAANFHPAVVEAGASEVPMLVLTADRPPELRDVGAPQTIDQTHLFGRSVRWYHDPGVPETSAAGSWRSLARRAVRATGRGPVHLNLPFREPLVASPGPLPAVIGEPVAVPHGEAASARERCDPLPSGIDCQRGVILVGGRSGVSADDVSQLSELTGWPVLADPLSAMRRLPAAISYVDSILRHQGFAEVHRPEVVIRVGRPAASKVLAEWVAASGARVIQVGGPGVIDPAHQVEAVCTMRSLLESHWTTPPESAPEAAWLAHWQHADHHAARAIAAILDGHEELSEPAVARAVAEGLAESPTQLVVASSMPIRDLEWFGGPEARAVSNRGANGIDGTMSTALGLALDGQPAAVLLGDIAFVHDSNALVGLVHRNADLRIIVVDNSGGGIFSFLPQRSSLPIDRFEQLFGTPHGTEVELLARAHGLTACQVTSVRELREQLNRPGPWVMRVVTDRNSNVELHAELTAAVLAALDDQS